MNSLILAHSRRSSEHGIIFKPAPRVPIGLSSGSSMSVASTGSGTRITTIQDRDSRPEYSYSDAGQSSISSFTHPHLSSAAVSVTDEGAAEDRQTTVWDHRPIWSSYLRSDSAISKPDSPSDSESEPRTVEIASDVENDTRSIPDSLDSHSDSDSHIYSQSHNPIPVSIQQPFTLVPQALSSLSSLDLNDSFSSSQFSQRTLRRSNFPVQNDFSAAGSGPSRMNSQSGSPSYYNRHQQEPATRHSYLTSQFQDTEAAVRSLLEEASRSRHHGIVNDVSSISSSSRGRPTPESAYTRGSDQGSPYSHSLQTQASGYSGTPTSTAASEVVLAPHAYPQYQRQSSNLRNYSPRVEQEPFSPLPTPTDASETFPYDDDRRKEEHDYDVRTPTRTIVAGSRSQTYDGAHPYPHPLVGLHVLPTTLPGNGPSGPAFESRRGSGHTETRVQKEIAPAKEEDTDNESIKYRRRPASDATTVSEQIVLSPPFPPAQSKADYATPDSSTSVTVTVASRDGNPPPPSNYSQPSTTIGYDQPSTTIGYNPTAAELEHPTLGALDEALSFIALERARMAANKKPVYEIAAGDLSSEGEGHGARRVQVESGGSGGRSKPTIAGSVNMDEDNTGTSPNAVTTMAGAGSSSGKRNRRLR
ncbi:hypothetical protein BKA70DRAFT_182986 [Coprinopsis sp. MPI-PUGE-AT-0042]|nr:hypothetical protein BKA70DRAFT_182986 [Coprinopsis sp. MPI-PUGE-AT-0042]